MTNVLPFTGETKGPVGPRAVAEGAAELESILVLGWDKQGQFYIASSSPDVGELLLLTKLGERQIMNQLDEETAG